jgi:hypothetical protein
MDKGYDDEEVRAILRNTFAVVVKRSHRKRASEQWWSAVTVGLTGFAAC